MKKSIIVIIGVIYIASIIFIGFFGMKITAYNPEIYATRIECINEDATDQYDTSKKQKYKLASFVYKQGASEFENVYTIRTKLYPENCTNKKIDFILDSKNKTARVDEFGNVFFKKPGTVTIEVKIRNKKANTEENNGQNTEEDLTYFIIKVRAKVR